MTTLLGRPVACFALFFSLVIGCSAIHLTCSDQAEAATKSEKNLRKPWIIVSLAPGGGTRGYGRIRSTIVALSGNPNGMVLHFRKVTLDLIERLQPEFIILSPQGVPWCRYTGKTGIYLQNFLWTLPYVVEKMHIPVLGICGGHQALALAFGGKVGPIRAGRDDCLPYTRGRQTGTVTLIPATPDPIFHGINGKMRIVESHFDEVKTLPPGFVLLATEKMSPVQIMRHPTSPVYGIQGHPEYFHSGRPYGGILIRNFLKIALTYNRVMRGRPQNQEPVRLSLLQKRKPGVR